MIFSPTEKDVAPFLAFCLRRGEARELVRMVLTGEADPETWNPRARKLLGVK